MVTGRNTRAGYHPTSQSSTPDSQYSATLYHVELTRVIHIWLCPLKLAVHTRLIFTVGDRGAREVTHRHLSSNSYRPALPLVSFRFDAGGEHFVQRCTADALFCVNASSSSIIWTNFSIGCAPLRNRPLMKKPGVPVIPTLVASSMSRWTAS